MFDFLIGAIVLYILFWIFIIAIGIALLLFVIKIIVAIADGVRSSNSATASSTVSSYEKRPIGDSVHRKQETVNRRNVRYTISDNSIEKKSALKSNENEERAIQAVYTLVSVEFTEGGKRYDYIAGDSNIRVGDTVTVDINGSTKTVKVVGVNIRKADELELPLSRYKHILNDDREDVVDVAFEIEKDNTEDDERHDDFDADFDTDENKELTPDEQEERERMNEPYICPECFEPYDGIYCENCGHSNDMPGEEELSEDDKFAEHFAAAWMFDQMDMEEQKRSDGIFGSGFEDEYDEDDEF